MDSVFLCFWLVLFWAIKCLLFIFSPYTFQICYVDRNYFYDTLPPISVFY